MKLCAIIPVKTFSGAKSRLNLPGEIKEDLCRIMLEEVLGIVSSSSRIDSVVVVSRDENVFEVAKKFGAVEITDDESGVNHAVSLADEYAAQNSFGASIVLPQDVPFIKAQDIDFLLQFRSTPACALVVPSRKFDGTNALLRMPPKLMETHYDEDSYKIHLATGRKNTTNTSLVFIRRMMMDIDDCDDLKYCMGQNEKPDLCSRIGKLLESR